MQTLVGCALVALRSGPPASDRGGPLASRLPACRRNKIAAVVRASSVCGPCVAPAPLASGGAPSPPLPSGLGLRGPPAPTGFRPPPRLGNTPALPWQGARPLTRRLRPPLPRLRGCVAVWGCARVVRLRARGLAGGRRVPPVRPPPGGSPGRSTAGGWAGGLWAALLGALRPPPLLRVGCVLLACLARPVVLVSSLLRRFGPLILAPCQGRLRRRLRGPGALRARPAGRVQAPLGSLTCGAFPGAPKTRGKCAEKRKKCAKLPVLIKKYAEKENAP